MGAKTNREKRGDGDFGGDVFVTALAGRVAFPVNILMDARFPHVGLSRARADSRCRRQ